MRRLLEPPGVKRDRTVVKEEPRLNILKKYNYGADNVFGFCIIMHALDHIVWYVLLIEEKTLSGFTFIYQF